MNRDLQKETDRQDPPLTRADVEALLQQAGSSERLVLHARNLHGADLTNLRLAGADLSGADLSGAYLSGANLSRADLSGAIVTPDQLKSTRSLQGTILPDGAKHP